MRSFFSDEKGAVLTPERIFADPVSLLPIARFFSIPSVFPYEGHVPLLSSVSFLCVVQRCKEKIIRG
ncbi:hypothetical protein C7438_0548 [Brockia lithotrophica]|uniref:Uncharacterized protein n=1 Tax=Brockia lithotrophica TaxID=933949 RepID=A0A660L4P6_9BACL|nr:hypothetical protein C7438_0548 [Brockia lithotrophica]